MTIDQLFNLQIDPWVLVLGFVFSVIGFGYFRYGKARGETIPLFVGVFLMVYPYFVYSALWLVLIGLALMAVPFAANRLGR